MNRHTSKLPDGRNVIKNDYSITTHSSYGSFVEGKSVDKFAEYEDAVEQGLLLKLPCKDVYFIVDKGTDYEIVMKKSIDNLNLYEIREIDKDGRYWSTQEQAEKSLKKIKNS